MSKFLEPFYFFRRAAWSLSDSFLVQPWNEMQTKAKSEPFVGKAIRMCFKKLDWRVWALV